MKWVVCVILMLVNNLFAQKAVAFLEAPAREKITVADNYIGFTKIPIQTVNGMILVRAEMDGEEGLFILDTGAPRMVVNSQELTGNALSASSYSTTFDIQSIIIEQFKWADVDVRHMEALVLDISHLERSTNRKILGMIGYNALTDREVMVDYDRGELLIYPARKNSVHRMAEPRMTIPFTLQGHLPVINVEICGRVLHFGLDTGAGTNLIDRKYFDQLPAESYTNLHLEEIQGLDQAVNMAQTADIKNTIIAGKGIPDMEYLFTDLSHLGPNSGIAIDGILGYEFFHRFRFSINYQKQKIYVW